MKGSGSVMVCSLLLIVASFYCTDGLTSAVLSPILTQVPSIRSISEEVHGSCPHIFPLFKARW